MTGTPERIGGITYWDTRWEHGPECPGSVGDHATAKAAWLNSAIADLSVASLVDWGCGDGHVAAQIDVGCYLGVEVSETAWALASEALLAQPHPAAVVLAPPGTKVSVRAEMSVSMDVVFHLTDDGQYAEWLDRLFGSATKFVAVHGTDYDSPRVAHMQHHRVTADAPLDWVLIEGDPGITEPGWLLWEHSRWV